MATGVQPKVDKRFLHQTAADTLMGQLLRRFWHPVALSTDLKAGSACPIRVLGENLTLYRGKSGRPYLIGGRCAHRCSVLHTGVIEDEQLRCMYHGWRYNGDGVCTDMPAEKKSSARPKSDRRVSCARILRPDLRLSRPQPVPEFDLPRKEVFEDGGRSCSLSAKPGTATGFRGRELIGCSPSELRAHVGQAEQFGRWPPPAVKSRSSPIPKPAAASGQIATRSNGSPHQRLDVPE